MLQCTLKYSGILLLGVYWDNEMTFPVQIICKKSKSRVKVPFLRLGQNVIALLFFSSKNDKYSFSSKFNDKPELKNEGCCC